MEEIVKAPPKRRLTAVLLAGLLLVAAAAACGGKDPTSPTGDATAEELSGTIEIDGSSTVFPVTAAVAEEFRKEHGGVNINVGFSGTGGGFKRFTAGETAISDASRPIKDSEEEAAAENGIEYIELRIGTDGLSVMVSLQNDFIDCLSIDQLNKIWKPESTVFKWSDINPDWPDNDFNLYGPGTDSGTFDYFTEEVNGEAKVSRADYTASEDDNVLVRGIAGDRNALGYFGYAYYAENADKLKVIGVDSGDGCVVPSVETIEDGTYSPLSRPLYHLRGRRRALKNRPEVATFVDFFLDNAPTLVREVGYIPEARLRLRRGSCQGGSSETVSHKQDINPIPLIPPKGLGKGPQSSYNEALNRRDRGAHDPFKDRDPGPYTGQR